MIIKLCFWLKYESSIHDMLPPLKKVVSSESGEKYAQIKHHLQVKQSRTALYNMSVDFIINREWTFSLEEALLCIIDSYFRQRQLVYI